MAFPVPAHLPRRAEPQDATSRILSRMDEATNKTLNATLAQSWLKELDETIQDTRQRIHDRIHSDYPQFEEQLETSISIQERLNTLKTNVDELGESISNPETGLVPTLLSALRKHSALANEAAQAKIRHDALEHLAKCYSEYRNLVSLSEGGDLPQAIHCCDSISRSIRDAPSPLDTSMVMADFKRKFNATRARTEELLGDAFSRSITFSPQELSIHDTVQVRQSDKTLSLQDIISSLSPDALSNHLSTLRRDMTTHFIEGLLKQPMAVNTNSEANVHRLVCFPSPPNDEILSSRLANLSKTLDFISAHLFSRFPETQQTSFQRSLCKSITTNVLNTLLIPSLPNSFSDLSSYLELVREAVSFEEKYIIGLLGNDPHDRPVKQWASSIGGHYERRRRTSILDEVRKTILEPENMSEVFTVQVEIPLEAEPPAVILIQPQVDEQQPKSDDDAWGFDDSDTQEDKADPDGWGFDDDLEDGTETDATSPTATQQNEEHVNGKGAKEDPDPGDAWGWNDEEEPTPDSGEATDESAWDDPWGDGSTSSEPVEVRPPPAPSIKAGKVATRLEKLANKGKKAASGSSPSSLQSSASSSPAIPPAPPVSMNPRSEGIATKRPSKLSLSVPKETYVVSSRMREVLAIVNDVLRESQEFTNSRLVTTEDPAASQPGSTLSRTAASVLDLYRALYPAVFKAQLESIEGPIRYSNNCLYLSKEVERISVSPGVKELVDCASRFKVLGDSWYADAIEKYRISVDTIITDGASGFTYTGEQERYDECESAMNRALQEIRRLQRWKNLLTKSKYYMAIGLVTDAALSRVLEDVLALPDIPELESHRLSELCRILHALEGLFVEDPEQPPFVVAYVPSWLKYSYLSELLEASMADTTYLFESGALVDFEIDELVRLVKALFADTVLRTNTINKLLEGHPVSSEA
ncbi:ribosome biogenesis protein ytm1 [Marasmius crinis-equi]|uniref:Ribosome biogenesis protein ytm1 n=1 Tax=Marasmius crinis-equi TaxID=585013 RepID=A0ABR3EZ44_9AGAR